MRGWGFMILTLHTLSYGVQCYAPLVLSCRSNALSSWGLSPTQSCDPLTPCMWSTLKDRTGIAPPRNDHTQNWEEFWMQRICLKNNNKLNDRIVCSKHVNTSNYFTLSGAFAPSLRNRHSNTNNLSIKQSTLGIAQQRVTFSKVKKKKELFCVFFWVLTDNAHNCGRGNQHY